LEPPALLTPLNICTDPADTPAPLKKSSPPLDSDENSELDPEVSEMLPESPSDE
jgi:hypothetical protein